jgi:hypothetical protein
LVSTNLSENRTGGHQISMDEVPLSSYVAAPPENSQSLRAHAGSKNGHLRILNLLPAVLPTPELVS